MGDAHWDGVFTTKTDEETSWFEPEPVESLAVIDGQSVTPRDSVIDVGAGTSRLVDALVSRGHAVTLLDASSAALGRTRRRLGPRAAQVEWIEADITAWRPTLTYDVWHDRAAFHFLTQPQQRTAYRDALSSALSIGGLVVLATFASSGPTQCSGLPVARYSQDDLADVLGADFTVVESREVVHTTPWGDEQPFTWVAARRQG